MDSYRIEVWDKSGIVLGDIRQLCSNLKWSKQRNEADTLSFDLDLTKYEQYLELINLQDNPYSFLEAGRTDLRLRRGAQYMVGTNANKFAFTTADPSVKMSVNATGYLNYYKQRFLNINYTNTPQHEILWGVIDQCNQKPNGDYGIRQGTHRGAVVNRDRNQVRKEVKSFFQQMSNVINGCDFEFTPDKLLNTYEAIGTYRKDIVLSFPGNIDSFAFNRSTDSVANYIFGVGSGNGEDAIQAFAGDSDSQDYLYLREKVASWNSVIQQATLQQNTDALLHFAKDILELPTVTLHSGEIDLSTVSVGDTIKVDFSKCMYSSLKHITGDYRIEKIDVQVDDNDNEIITLTFDDLDIDAIISKQDEA